jgi:hypothetical protein
MTAKTKMILTNVLLFISFISFAQTINIDALVTNDCDIANDGRINITVTGGTAPYTYL